MTNIERLNAEIQENEERYAKIARKNFEDAGIDGELTDEERRTLEEIRSEKRLTVVQEDEFGRKTEVTAAEYVKELDDRIVKTNTTPPVKLMDGFDLPDVAKVHDEMADTVKSKVIGQINDLTGTELDTAEFDRLTEETMTALRKMFKMDTLDADRVIGKLSKMPLSVIAASLPRDIITTFCSEDELRYHQAKAKQTLVAAIGFLIVTGPQLDNLTDYINHENRKMTVMARITQCEVDTKTMLTSDESLAQLVEETKHLRDDRAASFEEIIHQQPDPCYTLFSKYAVMSDKMADAYLELMEEFQDAEDRVLIEKEVEINRNKANVYRSICNLDLFNSRAIIYLDSIRNDKRISADYIEKQAMDVVDRLKRLKIPVSFPGYTGNETTSREVYYQYIGIMIGRIDRETKKRDPGVVESYNTAIKMLDRSDKDTSDLMPIKHDAKLFADAIIIIMGRIAKYLSRNTSTKYDAIIMDGYFKLFCMMPSDIFMINHMNKILTPIMDHIKSLPQTKPGRK